MMTMKRLGVLVVLIAAGTAIWITADLRKSVSVDLRDFDPQEVARLDTEMWRSYYAKQRLKLFNQLAYVLRRQYHMSLARSYVVAFHAAKAAFVFKDGHERSDYERALPDLLSYYQSIHDVSRTPFNVQQAAELELEWWIVHRERDRNADGALAQALANLAGEVYQLPSGKFAEHGRFRAEAMEIRDGSAERGGVSEADWDRIHGLLSRSWLSLWQAVNARD